MRVELPVLYSQMDARWATKLLGFNTASNFNFYNYACFVTDMTMICRYYGKDLDPAAYNDRLKDLGPGAGFAAGSGNYVYGAITKVFSDIKEKYVPTPAALTDDQINEIRTALDNGYPVIFRIDYNPKTVELDSHFVTVVDYNPSDENDFTIADPLGGTIKSLKSYLGWLKPSARKTIEAYLIYTGKVPAKGVLVPNDIYPNLVHGSSEWDKTSAEYLPDRNPKETGFEDVQRVVNGFKSDATQAKNTLADTQKELATAKTEVQNRIDQLANKDKECQQTLALKDAEISALKSSAPNIEKLKAQYEGTISALQSDLREAQKQGGIKDLEIAKLKSQVAGSAPAVKNNGILEAFVAMIKNMWGK